MRTWLARSILVVSAALAGGGIGLIVWTADHHLAWQTSVTGALVCVIGILSTRMAYRAYRNGVVPGPSSTVPILIVTIFAMLWNVLAFGIVKL